MGYRATSLSAAIEDFAIMSLCNIVYVCPSSSFTEWIQEQEGVDVRYYNQSRNIDWHPLTKNASDQISDACRTLFKQRYTGWHVMSGDPTIEISMTHLAVLRRLTEKHLTSFLSFLDFHGIRPNSNWLALKTLGRLLVDAEQTHDERIMPILENRTEYLQWSNRSQGWLHHFLRIKLFDFLMSRFDVRIRFRQTGDDNSFYFAARSNHKTWLECEHALEIRKGEWHPKKKQRYI